MITSAWPYILRLALSMYFVFNHLPPILSGLKGIKLNESIFACTSEFLPPIASYNIWHGGFMLLAILILFWPRPVIYLSISLIVLFLETYLSFSIEKYNASTLLMLTCILINIALLIIYGKLRRY